MNEIRKISDEPSTNIRRLLGMADEQFGMRTILESNVLISEVRQSLDTLKAEVMAPAGREGVKRVVGQRFAIWRPRERPEAEWTAFWDDYEIVLGLLPVSSIEGGMRAWIKNGATRLPYPGELLPLARNAETPEEVSYARALRVLKLAPIPEQADQRRERAHPAELKAVMDDFRAKMAAKRDDKFMNRMRPAGAA